MDHVIGMATKGVSTGIAVASELIAGQKGKQSAEAREQSKHAEKAQEHDDDDDQNLTERAWDLDEAADEIPPGEEQTTGITAPNNNAVAEAVHASEDSLDGDAQHADTTRPAGPQPLPMAVILPQRRPRDRNRGFIRAYAPVLAEYSGISQETFISFINTWNVESKASPIFDVINIACFGIGFIPNGIASAVSTAVGTASMVAQEIQGRYRSNKWLDKFNEELFKPCGLMAMVMTYKPELPDDIFLRADTTDPTNIALTKVLDMSQAPKLRQLIYKLRDTSGTAHGDAEVPEFAPLVYPSLDKALISATPESSLMKRNAVAVQDYFDRRAQADFAAKNPHSRIAQALPPQQKPFVNRYCDPNHPCNNGSVFALVSGGKFDPIGAGRVRRAEAKARRKGEPTLTEEERFDALMGRKVRNRVTGTPSKTIPVLGKMLKKDVLYLVIVNLPSAEVVQMVEASLQ